MASSSSVLRALVIAQCAMVLQACGGGSDSGSTTDTADPVITPPAPTTPTAEICRGQTLSSGDLAVLVQVGNPFSYIPPPSDWEKTNIRYGADNLPPWASLDAATGRLSGTPTAADVGVYKEIVFTATDGESVLVVDTLSIAVAENGNGAITLTWTPPTERVDATVLTNLAGYRIYHSRSGSGYATRIDLDNAGLTSYVIESLSAGRHCFAITAVDAQGQESALSDPAEKTVM